MNANETKKEMNTVAKKCFSGKARVPLYYIVSMQDPVGQTAINLEKIMIA